jgi:hypothetical protein
MLYTPNCKYCDGYVATIHEPSTQHSRHKHKYATVREPSTQHSRKNTIMQLSFVNVEYIYLVQRNVAFMSSTHVNDRPVCVCYWQLLTKRLQEVAQWEVSFSAFLSNITVTSNRVSRSHMEVDWIYVAQDWGQWQVFV